MTDFYLLDHPNPHGPNYYESRRKPCRVIVVHITAGLEDLDMRGDDISAERTAQYAASTTRDVSWHGGSDSDSYLYLLPSTYTAWHVQNYNSGSYGWEISKRDTTWADEPDDWKAATLRNTADGMRPIVNKYNIPLRLLTRAQVDAGWAGFVYHSVLDPTRRTDPGKDFPIAQLFQLIREEKDDMSEAQFNAIMKELDDVRQDLGSRNSHSEQRLREQIKAAEERLHKSIAKGAADGE